MGLCQSKTYIENINPIIDNKIIELDKKLELDIALIQNINPDDVPYFTFDKKIFYAHPCNIYDGDTFTIVFILNNFTFKYKCRCLGYDSPEMKPLLSNPNRDHEKELALKAKKRLEELLTANSSGLVQVTCGPFDKYGRILVTINNGIDAESINDIMIKEGHGKPYNGGTKEKWNLTDM